MEQQEFLQHLDEIKPGLKLVSDYCRLHGINCFFSVGRPGHQQDFWLGAHGENQSAVFMMVYEAMDGLRKKKPLNQNGNG